MMQKVRIGWDCKMKKSFQFLILIISVQMMFACVNSNHKPDLVTQNNVTEKKHEPIIDSTNTSGNKQQRIQSETLDSAQNVEVQSYVKSKNWSALEQWGYARLTENPKDIKALNILGLVSYYKNKPMVAKYYFNKALELSPGNGAILNNLGLVLQLEGNEREAIISWRKAVEAKSNRSADAQSNLVAVFAKGKDYRKVMGIADRFDYLKSNNVGLLVNLGIAYMANNQFDMAERLFSRALELDDSNKVALINYAILNIEHQRNLDLGRSQLDRLSFLGVQSDMQVTVNRLLNKLESAKSK